MRLANPRDLPADDPVMHTADGRDLYVGDDYTPTSKAEGAALTKRGFLVEGDAPADPPAPPADPPPEEETEGS